MRKKHYISIASVLALLIIIFIFKNTNLESVADQFEQKNIQNVEENKVSSNQNKKREDIKDTNVKKTDMEKPEKVNESKSKTNKQEKQVKKNKKQKKDKKKTSKKQLNKKENKTKLEDKSKLDNEEEKRDSEEKTKTKLDEKRKKDIKRKKRKRKRRKEREKLEQQIKEDEERAKQIQEMENNKGYQDLTEQELKARAQFLKDDNGGWVPEGELEPYDLPQPALEDLILYMDNTELVNGDFYDNLFPDKSQIYNNSVNYDYPYGQIEDLGTQDLYTIEDLEYHGAMLWNGYKYTFYSEAVLPGGAMKIPGRHIEDGFVVDEYGYITGASDYYPKGTILDSPFGRPIKIRDVFWHNQPEYRIDIYTR